MFQAIAKLRTRATVVVGCMVMLHFSLGLRGFMITIMLIATIKFMVWVMVALGDMVMLHLWSDLRRICKGYGYVYGMGYGKT